jgi:hypothetical protein
VLRLAIKQDKQTRTYFMNKIIATFSNKYFWADYLVTFDGLSEFNKQIELI